MEYIIAAVIGLVAGIIGAIINGAFQRAQVQSQAKANDATAIEKIRQACTGLIDPLQKQIDDLQIDLQDWKNWAFALVDQIKGFGHEPVPFKSSKRRDGS